MFDAVEICLLEIDLAGMRPRMRWEDLAENDVNALGSDRK